MALLDSGAEINVMTREVMEDAGLANEERVPSLSLCLIQDIAAYF